MGHWVKAHVCWSLLTNLRHQGREGAAPLLCCSFCAAQFRLLRRRQSASPQPFMELRYRSELAQPEIAGTFLSLIEPEPNYDHVLDNRYLIIQLVTRTQSRIIPTISEFQERSTLASSCSAQASLWLSSFYRTKILYSLPPSHVIYGEFEYQRNLVRDEKD